MTHYRPTVSSRFRPRLSLKACCPTLGDSPNDCLNGSATPLTAGAEQRLGESVTGGLVDAGWVASMLGRPPAVSGVAEVPA